MKCFLYARKSSEAEERQAMSIEAQIAELRQYAEREGITIDKTFTESKSAKTPGRPIFNNMIELIHASKEKIGILTWHPDRLARNSVDGGQIIYLVDQGRIAALRFCTFWFEATPQGLFMLQVAFGQSKYYSDNLSENVKRGIRQKLRRGEYPRMAPFGYLNDPKLKNIVPDPVHSKVIKKAFEEFAAGNDTLTSIGEKLHLWGLVNKHGKPIGKSSVDRILKNPVYMGLIVHQRETHQGNFTPIVSKQLFDQVQRQLQVKSRPRKKNNIHHFPFTNLLHCGECGSQITAQFAKGNGGLYRYYRCSKKRQKCSQPYIQEQLLVDQLKTRLLHISISEDWRNKMSAQLAAWKQNDYSASRLCAQKVGIQLEEIQTKLDKLVNSFLDGIIEKDMYVKQKDKLIKQKMDVQKKKSIIERTGSSWVEPVQDWINTLFLAQKLTVGNNLDEIRSLMKKIGTNHELFGKRAGMELKKEFAFVSEIKGGKGFTEHQKTQFAARCGISFNESSLRLTTYDEIRTYFIENIDSGQ